MTLYVDDTPTINCDYKLIDYTKHYLLNYDLDGWIWSGQEGKDQQKLHCQMYNNYC